MTNKLPIISAEERLKAKKGITITICGETGIGKTSLLKTLKEPTLCLDFEAGLLAVPEWKGDVIKIDTWDMARDIACLIGNVNKASKDGALYSLGHFNRAKSTWGDPSQFEKYDCLFVDSITVASRLCLQWCKAQSSNSDGRAPFGVMVSEMMLFLNQCQNFKDKDTIFVGILHKRINESNQVSWELQVEGNKLGLELPGIVDEVFTLTLSPNRKPSSSSHSSIEHEEPPRVFICRATNPYGYPAKDRSGKLKMEEPADLSAILAKIKGEKAESHVQSSPLPSSSPAQGGKAYPPAYAGSKVPAATSSQGSEKALPSPVQHRGRIDASTGEVLAQSASDADKTNSRELAVAQEINQANVQQHLDATAHPVIPASRESFDKAEALKSVQSGQPPLTSTPSQGTYNSQR